MSEARFKQAARLLHEAHEQREPFRPLPAALAPHTGEAAYEIQDAFVALRAQTRGAIAGYKIALASPQMRRFVGVDQPQAGVIFESTVLPTPASVRAADYLRLIVEFEIAVEHQFHGTSRALGELGANRSPLIDVEFGAKPAAHVLAIDMDFALVHARHFRQAAVSAIA